MLAGVPAEVREGALVRVQELGQALVGAGPVEAAPAVAERQHEDVQRGRSGCAKARCDLAPVDLALLARWRLEAASGVSSAQRRGRRSGATKRFTVS